jgi:hypothetical protein
MDKQTTPDGYGGVITTWTEGAEIMVAYSFDDSTQARIAQQEGVTNRYTLTTRKSVVLRFPDVVKRAKDGKTFRVTSDGDDNSTPSSTSLNLRQVEAEQWELT